jgi:hypothetical protein
MTTLIGCRCKFSNGLSRAVLITRNFPYDHSFGGGTKNEVLQTLVTNSQLARKSRYVVMSRQASVVILFHLNADYCLLAAFLKEFERLHGGNSAGVHLFPFRTE